VHVPKNISKLVAIFYLQQFDLRRLKAVDPAAFATICHVNPTNNVDNLSYVSPF
jgi:ABC-type transporter Mla MlaB component